MLLTKMERLTENVEVQKFLRSFNTSKKFNKNG